MNGLTKWPDQYSDCALLPSEGSGSALSAAPHFFSVILTALLSLTLSANSVHADGRGSLHAGAPPSLNATVSGPLTSHMEALIDRLLVEKRDMTLDGVRVFEASDKFLPGKIAIAMAHVLVDLPASDPRRARYLQGFRELSVLTIDDANDSWGIYYYISALHRLKEAGLLDGAVDPAILERLKVRLDWRAFVRTDDLTLIDLPNNYYGVAFSIARLRYLLGWEDASASEALLARTLDHFRRYSGDYGFADETDGQGRFDRYSVLLIGEIAQRFIETGLEPPPEVRDWLRKSVDLMLLRVNERGEGFEYGRSIGVYGETAFVEVFSAAAALGVLTEEETRIAYAFSARVARRYADFWIDADTGSVNLWDQGRKTDAYRGKHRILGENLSLGHQFAYTNSVWNDLGWKDRAADADIAAWSARLPRSTTTWFSCGENDRLLVTYRDGERLIGLPVINGAFGQHMNNPYFPIPYSPGVLAGAPDETFPQLLPRITLSDGAVLQPLSWATNVRVETRGDVTVVTWVQHVVDHMGENAPRPDRRISVETRYELRPGGVRRADRIRARTGVEIQAVDTMFASFSHEEEVAADGARYGVGEVAGWHVTGLTCAAAPLDPAVHAAPVGAFRSLVACSRPDPGRDVEIGWDLTFRTPSP